MCVCVGERERGRERSKREWGGEVDTQIINGIVILMIIMIVSKTN